MDEQTPTTESEVQQDDATDILYASVEPAPIQQEAEVQEAPEVDAEIVEEAAAPEGEVEVVSSITQLMEQEDYDPEWFNSLRVPVKVNGEQSEATLADLVKSYQIGEAAEQRLEEAKAKAQALNQEATQITESAKAHVAETAGLVQLAEKLFSLDAEEANLARLREEGDNVGYLAAKDALQEKRQAIDSVKKAAADVFQQSQSADESISPEKIAEEQQALRSKIPEWSDPEVKSAEETEIYNYLTEADAGYGFTPEEVANAGDHRLFLMARKAMLFDKQQSSIQTSKKRVLKIPKVMQPGTPEAAPDAPKDRASILYGNS